MLQQCRPGSVLILHMPEKGFREHELTVLEQVLSGLSARGLRCATLSECAQLEAAVQETDAGWI